MRTRLLTAILLVLIAIVTLQLTGCIETEELSPDFPATHGDFPVSS